MSESLFCIPPVTGVSLECDSTSLARSQTIYYLLLELLAKPRRLNQLRSELQFQAWEPKFLPGKFEPFDNKVSIYIVVKKFQFIVLFGKLR